MILDNVCSIQYVILTLAMKRTTVFLDEAIERDLKTLAYRRNEPVSHLVREALARYVASEIEASPRLPSFVGIGDSGRTDIAERHEELLFADLEREMGLAPRRKRAKSAAKSKARSRR
jgi:hypothetical protein